MDRVTINIFQNVSKVILNKLSGSRNLFPGGSMVGGNQNIEETKQDNNETAQSGPTKEREWKVLSTETMKTFCLLVFVVAFISSYLHPLLAESFSRTIDVMEVQRGLCLKYDHHKILLEPWARINPRLEDLDEHYVSQKFLLNDEMFSSLLDLYDWNPEKLKDKRKVLVGEQGMGKTTSLLRATQEWCRKLREKSILEKFIQFSLPSSVVGKVSKWIGLELTYLPTFFFGLQINETVNHKTFVDIIRKAS